MKVSSELMYLIPYPKKITESEGSYCISCHDRIYISDVRIAGIKRIADLLNTELNKSLGYALRIDSAVSESKGAVEHGIRLGLSAKLRPDQYKIVIDNSGIDLIGGETEGLRYSVQTLRQILRQTGAIVPCLSIEDEPDIPVRAYITDVTRGRIPTLDSLKKLADSLSFYKMNQMQLYIEHTFMFDGLSEMWRDDTPLTSSDIIELDEYCSGIGIELVPALASFGHLYKLLRTKDYEHLCELENPGKEPFSFVDRMYHHTVNVSDKESVQFIESLILKYMQLFKSDHFNIGGDETFDLGKGKSCKLQEEIGHDRMYLEYIKKICLFLTEHGKIPMFWGDIIARFPELIKELPGETICLNWGYESDQDDEAAKAFNKAGAIQYLCPGVQGWNQFMNRVKDSYDNIRLMCQYAGKYGAAGVLVTDWGDFGAINDPRFNRIGQIYGAAFSWNKNIPGYDEINKQISLIEYGDPSERLVSTVAKISDLQAFCWEEIIMYREAVLWSRFDKDEIFDRIKAEKADEYNEQLEGIKTELYGLSSLLPHDKKTELLYYINATEAVQIWNRIGRSLYSKEGRPITLDGDFDAINERRTAARDLEIWFMDFKELWRRNSKESELFRVQEVINWYADLLRG